MQDLRISQLKALSHNGWLHRCNHATFDRCHKLKHVPSPALMIVSQSAEKSFALEFLFDEQLKGWNKIGENARLLRHAGFLDN